VVAGTAVVVSAQVTCFAAADAAVIDRLLDVAGGHAADHSARIVRDVMLITDVALTLSCSGQKCAKETKKGMLLYYIGVISTRAFLDGAFQGCEGYLPAACGIVGSIYTLRSARPINLTASRAACPQHAQGQHGPQPSTGRVEVVDEGDDATVVSGSMSPGTLTEVPGGAV